MALLIVNNLATNTNLFHIGNQHVFDHCPTIPRGHDGQFDTNVEVIASHATAAARVFVVVVVIYCCIEGVDIAVVGTGRGVVCHGNWWSHPKLQFMTKLEGFRRKGPVLSLAKKKKKKKS